MRGRNELSAAGKRKFTYASPILVAAIGLALSLGAFQVARGLERQATDLELQRNTENIASAVRRETWSHMLLVEALGGFTADTLDLQQGAYPQMRMEFRSFVRPFLERHPSIQALEWIPRVSAQERAKYEAEARADGFPGFQITEKDENGVLVRAGERPEYYPVYFLQPYSGNEAALGYDLASNPTRRQALEQARDTGQPTATARILLVQETRNEFGFRLFQPVYRDGTTTDTVEDRRKNLAGFALGVFRMGDIVDKALTYLDWRDIDITLYDQAATPDNQFLVFRAWGTRGRALQRSPSRSEATQGRRETAIVDVGQRQWAVECTATPGSYPKTHTWQPLGMLITRLVLTALAVGYVAALLGRAERARKFAAQTLAAKEKLEHEITERKQAEEGLKRQAAILEATPDFVGYADAKDLHVLYFNRAGRVMIGLTPDEDVTKMKMCDVHPEWTNRLLVETALPTARRDGVWAGECAFLHRDGHEIPVLMVLLAHKTSSGEVEVLSTISRDITERKRAEEKIAHGYLFQTALSDLLHASLEDLSIEEMLTRALERVTSVPELALEKKGIVFLAQDNQERLLLTASCGEIGELRNICATVPLGKCLCGRALETGKLTFASHLDGRHETHCEGTQDHGHYGVPIISSAQKVLGVMSLYVRPGVERNPEREGFLEAVANVLAGIIERKWSEEAVSRAQTETEARAKELARVNRQLQRTMEEKEDFLRAVSHDLSAPLRNIAGMASFLKTQYKSCLDDTAQDRLDRIVKNVTVQSGLIRDLLELSRIKTRRGKFERTDLAELVHGLIEQLGFDLEKKSGEVLVEGDFPTIWCEANRMRQVFQNLLDNAIKYAHPERPPRIVISGRRREGNYVFSVSDNGIGIAPEDTEKIFFVFRRARNAYTAQIEGKGVGLASVRTIVETYGGGDRGRVRGGRGKLFHVHHAGGRRQQSAGREYRRGDVVSRWGGPRRTGSAHGSPGGGSSRWEVTTW